jgi:hypothetical protein
MEYIVVQAGTNELLVERVTEKLAEGFVPLGGVCVAPYWWNDEDCHFIDYEYYQAMVKGSS